MSRYWSLLFFLVPILAIAAFVMAAMGIAPLRGAWMPPSFSDTGDTIDQLANGIHLLAAVILVGTVLTIGWVVWRFDHRRSDVGTKALYVHHNTKLEIAWSVIPACILIFLAFFQMKFWTENKLDRPMITVNGQSIPQPPMVMVKARRFGWEFYYPGKDGLLETEDDIYVENLLVLPANEAVVLQLESRDVIHSFCVPELRLKQDIVPGMTHFSWFNSREFGDIEVMCTELCGWGHYKMKADFRLVDRATFEQWLAEQANSYVPEFQSEPTSDVARQRNPQSDTAAVDSQ